MQSVSHLPARLRCLNKSHIRKNICERHLYWKSCAGLWWWERHIWHLLSCKPGGSFWLFGPNGAGKTTTIRHLMGFLKCAFALWKPQGRRHICILQDADSPGNDQRLCLAWRQVYNPARYHDRKQCPNRRRKCCHERYPQRHLRFGNPCRVVRENK